MRQYERSGVTVDQCGECRGIFLDRGELEKLFDAEANWNRQNAGAPAPGPQQGYPPPPPPPVHHQPAHIPPPPPPQHGYPPQPAYGGHHGYHGHSRRKRPKTFFDDLFG